MGWTFSSRWSNRKELLVYLRSGLRIGEGYELLKSSAVGNNHWYLCRRKSDGRVFIGLDLMKGGRSEGWGYKDLDETCGPNEVNCPMAYLDQAGPAEGYAVDWRERVREYHRKHSVAKAVKLEPGKVVTYGGVDYRLDRSVGRRGWYVSRVPDEQQFRMNARQVAAAIRAEAAYG